MVYGLIYETKSGVCSNKRQLKYKEIKKLE